MAKVKYIPSRKKHSLRDIADNYKKDAKSMKRAAFIIREETIDNLRAGNGVNDRPLPPITDGTKERRRKLATVNKTNSKYSPDKSNVTFSGDFVKAYRVKFLAGDMFEGTFSGIHKRYKGLRGKPIGERKPNYEIASEMAARGWRFYGITKKARERILQNFSRFIKRRK